MAPVTWKVSMLNEDKGMPSICREIVELRTDDMATIRQVQAQVQQLIIPLLTHFISFEA